MLSTVNPSLKVLALIMARGGSKGIKRKNLAKVAGKSLLEHSITHGLMAKAVNRVIVSTEDQEIAQRALDAGAEVPFIRPARLAEDHVLDLPVFIHVLDELKAREGYEPDIIVQLRPTAPHREIDWVDDCVQLLIDQPLADSVCTVSEPNQHPYRMFKRGDGNTLLPLLDTDEEVASHLVDRHDWPEVLFYNCVIDVMRLRTIREKGSTTGSSIIPYKIPSEEAFDTDRLVDLEMTEISLSNRENQK